MLDDNDNNNLTLLDALIHIGALILSAIISSLAVLAGLIFVAFIICILPIFLVLFLIISIVFLSLSAYRKIASLINNHNGEDIDAPPTLPVTIPRLTEHNRASISPNNVINGMLFPIQPTTMRNFTLTSYKIVFIGDTSIGKTCLIQRCLDNPFNENTPTTIGVDFPPRKIFKQHLSLNLWDIGCNNRYAPLWSSYLQGSHLVVLTFDLTIKETFTNATTKWFELAKNVRETKYVLVGCKQDMVLPGLDFSEEATQWATQQNIPYVATSAKNNINIDELFTTITRLVDEDVIFQLPTPPPSDVPVLL